MRKKPTYIRVYDTVLKTGHRKPRLARFCQGFGAVACIAVLLLCSYLVAAKASKPFIVSYSESKDIAVLKRESVAVAAENKRLREQRDYLLTARGKEAEARKLGWVKDGEVSIVVEKPPRTIVLDIPQNQPKKKTFWGGVGEKLIGLLVRPETSQSK